jgi:hypothetical protein
MAVVNEDHYELTMTKGLYNAGSAGGNDVPDGFCQLLQNMIADGQRLRLRPNFSAYTNYRVSTTAPTNTASLEMLDSYNVYSKTRRVWSVGGGTNQPNLIFQHFKTSTNIGTLLSDATTNAPLSAHGNSAWTIYDATSLLTHTGFAQFGTIIYGSTAGSNVRKFSLWNPTLSGNGDGTATHAAVAGSPASLNGLVFFRDRFFGWFGDTIYYTELATTSPGGLPEVWNTGTNIIKVPSNLAGVAVQEVMVYNDRLIVFTNAGLFSLRTQGSPQTDWAWNTIDENIKVNAQVQTCQTRGVIYYADDTGVWSYNGDNFNLISAPISNYFDINFDVTHIDSPIYNVYPMHDGLLLCIKQPAAVFSGGGTPWRWDVGTCVILYYSFKWGTWCEWKPYSNFDVLDVLGTAYDHRSAVHGGQPTSWIFMRLDGLTSDAQFYEVDFAGFSGELYDVTNTFPTPGTVSHPIQVNIVSQIMDMGNQWKYKYLKYAYIDTYYFGNTSQTLTYTWLTDDHTFFPDAGGEDIEIKPVDNLVQTKFQKIGAGFKTREVELQLSVYTNTYFEIKAVHIIGQLGRDELRTYEDETV